MKPPAAAATLAFLIHYLDEINKINQMNVRCDLFADLPTDSRRVCAEELTCVFACVCAQFNRRLFYFSNLT